MSALSITIVEQPTEFHRFRYETEVTGDKLGGLLFGRNGNKSFIKARVTGINPAVHQTITVVCGTVNPDGFPHPIYMVGDNCLGGIFVLKKEATLLAGTGGVLDIVLGKHSLVCMSTHGSKLIEAISKRKSANFNPFNKNIDEIKYTARNFKKVCLVWQVLWTAVNDPVSTVYGGPYALSAEINDAKLQPRLQIYGINPASVSVSHSQDIWIYFDVPLQHTDSTQYSVMLVSNPIADFELEDTQLDRQIILSIKQIKKHLLVVTKPDLVAALGDQGNEREKFFVVVLDKQSGMSSKNQIELNRPPPQLDLGDELDALAALGLTGIYPPSVKRSRRPGDPY